ncbi:YibE/F family protein [Actinomycetes bacterium KLBMP 9759]
MREREPGGRPDPTPPAAPRPDPYRDPASDQHRPQRRGPDPQRDAARGQRPDEHGEPPRRRRRLPPDAAAETPPTEALPAAPRRAGVPPPVRDPQAGVPRNAVTPRRTPMVPPDEPPPPVIPLPPPIAQAAPPPPAPLPPAPLPPAQPPTQQLPTQQQAAGAQQRPPAGAPPGRRPARRPPAPDARPNGRRAEGRYEAPYAEPNERRVPERAREPDLPTYDDAYEPPYPDPLDDGYDDPYDTGYDTGYDAAYEPAPPPVRDEPATRPTRRVPPRRPGERPVEPPLLPGRRRRDDGPRAAAAPGASPVTEAIPTGRAAARRALEEPDGFEPDDVDDVESDAAEESVEAAPPPRRAGRAARRAAAEAAEAAEAAAAAEADDDEDGDEPAPARTGSHSGHGHGHGHSPAPPAGRKVRILIAALLVPCAVATLVGLLVLWPWSPPQQAVRSGSEQPIKAEVVASKASECSPGAGDSGCVALVLRMSDGPMPGRDLIQVVPVEPGTPSFAVGDDLVLGWSGADPNDPSSYRVADFQRGWSLFWLAALFAASVLLLGRWRGLAALGALALSFAVLMGFVLPSILAGNNPLAVAIVGSCVIMFTVLYMTHGPSARTSTAVLGTLASLLLIGVLSALFSAGAALTGLDDQTRNLIATLDSGVDARGLLLAGIVIGALGVLDDVTVTQTSAVWELRRANPELGAVGLFAAAMRIGRDHVASAVNTLVLAYAGAALPLMLLFTISGRTLGEVIATQDVATEIVRTLVGSIGLVASVPITTALAAVVASKESPEALAAEVDGSAGLGSKLRGFMSSLKAH